jgi:NAD dependent epimerase/dehydratase family enzyme
LNGTAPGPVTNAAFAATLGSVLRRPAIVPAPGVALRVVLGEMATLVLDGQRVLPGRARELGFPFRYPSLEGALRQILG